MSFFRPRVIVLASILAFAVALPFFTTAHSRSDAFFFEVTAATHDPGIMQLYYDFGRGMSEGDSGRQVINPDATPQKYRFPLSAGNYFGLRLDPIDRAGALFLTGARIVDQSGGVVRRFNPDEFQPAAQIASLVLKNGGLELRTIPGAKDPILSIALDSPFILSVDSWHQLSAIAWPFSITFGLVLTCCARPLRRYRADAIARWCQTHPGRTVAALSALIVAVQCHPVIFFGKSFVSPDNGVLLLYESFPVLPGYQTTVTENAMRSDIGALMWWHINSPAIAHDALFRDHELPLWNRYALGGVPLLGQGQSMFGDPLNWLSILTRSAAWSWDARFVLSRWLLCCGLGLTALALVRHLPSALLVTVGAGFLGFFGYRLNHPSNFSLAYAPWILFAWVRLTGSDTWRARARWCLALMAANFSVLTSGTVKEAYMLIACLNLAGLLLLLVNDISWRERWRQLGLAAAAGAALVLATAPLWLTFLSTLRQSWTIYDTPAVWQVPPGLMLGFFDDLFSRQILPDEIIYQPAANFLFLLGLLWALAAGRHLARPRVVLALGAVALLCTGLIFGGVPAAVILQLPFIANIVHIGDTFSCPLIILVALLAGFGFEALWRRLGTPGWKVDFWLFVVLLGILGAAYLAAVRTVSFSDFFAGYGWSLIIAVVTLPAGLHLAQRRNDPGLFSAVLLTCLGLLLWRHCQYVRSPFDTYVFNPQIRVDLRPRSPAVDFVNARMKEPARPLGLGLNLFAGYNQLLGWESLLGVDALRSRQVDELAAAFGVTRVRDPGLPLFASVAAALLPALDLMNVRYFLGTHDDPPREIRGLEPLARLDLDVFASPTAWPRAFFTNQLWPYDKLGQLVGKVNRGDRRPFAAAARDDPTLPPMVLLLPHDTDGRTIGAAHGYRLTTNTTAFEIEAPSAGIVVLSESYYPDDFQVTVNGKRTDYFRVNHAYKGVYVGAPGTYTIEYRYWPRIMNRALVLSAIGWLGVAALGWLGWPLAGRARAAGSAGNFAAG